ncbi:Hypothetical protein LUCI_2630 [Lucifera butyrica]|uniref:Uracil-DNA glycosylase n=1 Tax=Lucifera butyrica TaxID=1351585 RepID=A0A498R3Y6_9FIRM|nr:Hypothetical protein LUCI_2630 [Lucifera butyrica]
MAKQAVLCLQCKYYYITWDKSFPYGCKAMGFKGALMPCLYVRQVSGTRCLSFADKIKGE